MSLSSSAQRFVRSSCSAPSYSATQTTKTSPIKTAIETATRIIGFSPLLHQDVGEQQQRMFTKEVVLVVEQRGG